MFRDDDIKSNQPNEFTFVRGSKTMECINSLRNKDIIGACLGMYRQDNLLRDFMNAGVEFVYYASRIILR